MNNKLRVESDGESVTVYCRKRGLLLYCYRLGDMTSLSRVRNVLENELLRDFIMDCSKEYVALKLKRFLKRSTEIEAKEAAVEEAICEENAKELESVEEEANVNEERVDKVYEILERYNVNSNILKDKLQLFSFICNNCSIVECKILVDYFTELRLNEIILNKYQMFLIHKRYTESLDLLSTVSTNSLLELVETYILNVLEFMFEDHFYLYLLDYSNTFAVTNKSLLEIIHVFKRYNVKFNSEMDMHEKILLLLKHNASVTEIGEILYIHITVVMAVLISCSESIDWKVENVCFSPHKYYFKLLSDTIKLKHYDRIDSLFEEMQGVYWKLMNSDWNYLRCIAVEYYRLFCIYKYILSNTNITKENLSVDNGMVLPIETLHLFNTESFLQILESHQLYFSCYLLATDTRQVYYEKFAEMFECTKYPYVLRFLGKYKEKNSKEQLNDMNIVQLVEYSKENNIDTLLVVYDYITRILATQPIDYYRLSVIYTLTEFVSVDVIIEKLIEFSFSLARIDLLKEFYSFVCTLNPKHALALQICNILSVFEDLLDKNDNEFNIQTFLLNPFDYIKPFTNVDTIDSILPLTAYSNLKLNVNDIYCNLIEQTLLEKNIFLKEYVYLLADTQLSISLCKHLTTLTISMDLKLMCVNTAIELVHTLSNDNVYIKLHDLKQLILSVQEIQQLNILHDINLNDLSCVNIHDLLFQLFSFIAVDISQSCPVYDALKSIASRHSLDFAKLLVHQFTVWLNSSFSFNSFVFQCILDKHWTGVLVKESDEFISEHQLHNRMFYILQKTLSKALPYLIDFISRKEHRVVARIRAITLYLRYCFISNTNPLVNMHQLQQNLNLLLDVDYYQLPPSLLQLYSIDKNTFIQSVWLNHHSKRTLLFIANLLLQSDTLIDEMFVEQVMEKMRLDFGLKVCVEYALELTLRGYNYLNGLVEYCTEKDVWIVERLVDVFIDGKFEWKCVREIVVVWMENGFVELVVFALCGFGWEVQEDLVIRSWVEGVGRDGVERLVECMQYIPKQFMFKEKFESIL